MEGLLKVEERNLFYRDSMGAVKELRPLCVLDFYVHESLQRKGVGSKLFSLMLEIEKIVPSKIAYDRPSPKLIKFLDKHYGLKHFINQNNNYVIFDDYFRSVESQKNSHQYRIKQSSNSIGSAPRFSQQHFRVQDPDAIQTIKKRDFNTNPEKFNKFNQNLENSTFKKNRWKLSNIPLGWEDDPAPQQPIKNKGYQMSSESQYYAVSKQPKPLSNLSTDLNHPRYSKKPSKEYFSELREKYQEYKKSIDQSHNHPEETKRLMDLWDNKKIVQKKDRILPSIPSLPTMTNLPGYSGYSSSLKSSALQSLDTAIRSTEAELNQLNRLHQSRVQVPAGFRRALPGHNKYY